MEKKNENHPRPVPPRRLCGVPVSAAAKALDALSVPVSPRWEAVAECDAYGDWCAVGPKYIAAELSLTEDAKCAASARSDAERMALAVNLSAPLAAVARAAMAFRHATVKGGGTIGEWDDLMQSMFAALDALEAAAAEGGAS